ncbi:hypothetical protein WJX73_008703 [Symbiochloris irregularis]|uniref:Uncharacterized protein n=1 Tax=Symbiochloris irregularis TaxID=706552 RepID=A0AAW1NYX8_9CHLO
MTASSSGFSCSAPPSPSYTHRSAVAETMADTSMPPMPLSTYTSPHRPTVTQWLEACVKEAVRNLDEAPFLQLYVAGENGQHDRTERHTVTPTVVQTPQLWSCIAEHLAQAAPEALPPLKFQDVLARTAVMMKYTTRWCHSLLGARPLTESAWRRR